MSVGRYPGLNADIQKDLNYIKSFIPPASSVVSTLAPVVTRAYNTLPPSVALARAVPPVLLNSATAAGKLAALKYLPGITGVSGARVLGTIHKYAPYAQWGWNLFKSGSLSSSKQSFGNYSRMAPRRFSYGRRGGSRMSYRKARRAPSYRRSAPLNRVSIVQRMPRAQIKQHVQENEVQNPGTGGTIFPIGGVAFGQAEDEREANNIRILSLNVRMRLKPQFASEAAQMYPVNVRIVLIKWSQGYVSPSVSSIIAAPAGDEIIGHFNQIEQKNFQVLYDRTVRVGPIGSNDILSENMVADERVVQIRKSLSQFVTYNGSSASQGDTRFFLIVIPHNSNGEGTVFAHMHSSVRFIDL